MESIQALLDYWFGDAYWQAAEADDSVWPPQVATRRWFNSSKKDDADMAGRFGDQVEQALAGELSGWAEDARGGLALVLLLDQLPRNIYRATAKAFAGDQQALALAMQERAADWVAALPWAARAFVYLPLMHAENLAAQQLGVVRFTELHQQAPAAVKPKLLGNLRFAREHLGVIERFGRFPHRNRLLGRQSTAEESAFLQHASRYGQ